jgi:hypothetical protein
VALKDETFFDNVTAEYRVFPASNFYLNLFYQRDSYDWLEGNVSRFGGGFTWKKKLDSLGDLFRALPKREGSITTVGSDSAKNSLKTIKQKNK